MRISFLRPVNPSSSPRIVRDEIQVPAPKEIEEGEPASKVRTIGVPLLMVMLLVGMMFSAFVIGGVLAAIAVYSVAWGS